MIVGGISTFGLDKALALSEIEWAGAMNYNDENNNIYSPQADLPESYDETELQWATKVGHYDRDAYYASNTAIAGDYIYVTGDGKLNKINKSTGVIEKTVGTVKSSNTNRTDYICIVDDVLYVAADTAIEAYNLADLSVKWNYPGNGNTANLGQYHPIQYLDIAGSGYIYCNGLFLNALDGTKVTIYTDNTKTTELDNKDFAWSSGAVVNDIFYVTDKVNVYAIDVANKVGIKDVRAGLLPEDKYKILQEIKSQNDKVTVFVGDGVNDAPSIISADVGVAMGAMGSDAAVDSADVVIMNDDIKKVGDAIAIAKSTRRKAITNIVFSLSIKFVIMVLSMIGLSSMGLAVFADVGVMLLLVINSLMLFKKKV